MDLGPSICCVWKNIFKLFRVDDGLSVYDRIMIKF